MGDSIERLTMLVAKDRRLLFTLTSYIAVLAIYTNLITTKSPVLGGAATILFLSIDSVFLGSAIFKKENAFFKLVFGILLLVMILGSLNWIALITYNLDISKSTLALLATTTISSALNKAVNRKNAI